MKTIHAKSVAESVGSVSGTQKMSLSVVFSVVYREKF